MNIIALLSISLTFHWLEIPTCPHGPRQRRLKGMHGYDQALFPMITTVVLPLIGLTSCASLKFGSRADVVRILRLLGGNTKGGALNFMGRYRVSSMCSLYLALASTFAWLV